MQHLRFWRFVPPLRVMIVAALFLAWAVPSSAGNQDNLLLNPDLSEGNGDTPDYWQHEAYAQGASQFTWISDQRPGQLEVSSTQLNDARWYYSMHLDPGWYHFTASISTQNFPQNGQGAALCLMEDGLCSQLVHGTSDWQAVGFYLKVGDAGADGKLACRLGGYSAESTGNAFCKDISAVAVNGPNPEDGDPSFDLDEVRSPPGPAAPAVAACTQPSQQ